MASVVSICNLALSHLGDRATVASIDPPEGSAQAEHCAQFWPIVRDEALTKFDWGFASRNVTTATIDEDIQDDPRWGYAYSRPSDFLMAREMTWADGTSFMYEPGSPYFEDGTLDDGTPVLFAATDLAGLRYTRRVSDPSRYPPKFVTAISYLLASYLAGPIIKGKAGVQTAAAMRAMWDKLSSEAATLDANQRHSSTAFKPAAVRARGSTAGGTYTAERGAYRHELPYWAQD